MKSKKDIKRSALDKFIAFGNKKKVFLSITLSTIILSIIGMPIMIYNETMLKYFILIWILEVIYLRLFLSARKEENKTKNPNKNN